MLAGRYELRERVGRGGMGAVWLARDLLLQRDVAAKEIVLPPDLDDEARAEASDRALREARAAARVDHPAVVTIHDVVMDDGRPWIVMEYVRSRSLQKHLDELGALPVTEVARIGAALAGALDAVHAVGILHRDVKPANVLLKEDGQVVLTDFGIAMIEGDTRLTSTGMVIGTPGFMAPERLRGDEVGPPSDLWSLGAVLYLAAEGRPAFDGGSSWAVASDVLTARPPAARLAGDLGPLLTSLLAADPSERVDARTAAECLRALAGEAGTAGRPPARTPVGSGPGKEGRPGASEEEPAEPSVTPQPSAPSEASPPSGQPSGSSEAASPPRSRTRGRVLAASAAAVLVVAAGWIGVEASGASLWSGGPDDGQVRPVMDPCDLLTDTQAERLAPQYLSPDEDAGVTGEPTAKWRTDCDWYTAAGAIVELKMTLRSYSTPAKASAAFAASKSDGPGDTLLTVTRIGDQVRAVDHYNQGFELAFRQDRNLVDVQYEVLSYMSDQKQRANLQLAAQYAAAALKRHP